MGKSRFVAAVSFLLLSASTAIAQQPPALGYVYPPVLRAGTTTVVQLGGYDFTPDMQFFVHDKRVKIEVSGPPGKFFVPEPPYWFGPKSRTTAFPIPREVTARITVPKSVPPGPVRWQVANANGASGTGLFHVTAGATVTEHRDRGKPQQLKTLPVSVAGRLRKIAEVDRYRVVALRDGPITVQLFARRLGSNFHGIIQVRDRTRRIIADVADTQGLDAAVTFAAKSGQEYEVSLHDVDFRGNRAFVYRLDFTHGPRVLTTIPAAGPRGRTIDVRFLGYGIASGLAKLETVTRKVAFPMDPRQTTLRYRLKTPFGDSPAIDIPLSHLSEFVVSASKNGKPHSITIPGAVTGRIGSSNRATFTFQVRKGESWKFAAQSRAINTRLDLSLSIRDSTGKQIASNDDLRMTPDAGLTLAVPRDGRYTCVVEDLSGRAVNADAVYRLAISRAEPSFTLSVPQQLKMPIQGKASLTVTAQRLRGFQGEISIHIKGLPADMKVTGGLKIPAGEKSVNIRIERTANAPSHAVLVKVVGKATVAGKTVVRTATATAAGNLCPRDRRENETTGILLATTLKPPFTLNLVDKNRQRVVHRGTTYPAEFLIRRSAGFTGEVLLMMAAKQSRHRQGIRGPIVTVPGNVDRVLYPCFMPEWLETDRTTRMVVLGVAKVKDPRGRVRYLTKPADARITMILEGALLKVSQQSSELTIEPGQTFAIPVRIARSAKLTSPVTISLEIPKELRGLVKGKPVTLAAGKNRMEFEVKTTANPKLTGRWRLTLKAIAFQHNKWAVVSTTQVPVEFAISRK